MYLMWKGLRLGSVSRRRTLSAFILRRSPANTAVPTMPSAARTGAPPMMRLASETGLVIVLMRSGSFCVPVFCRNWTACSACSTVTGSLPAAPRITLPMALPVALVAHLYSLTAFLMTLLAPSRGFWVRGARGFSAREGFSGSCGRGLSSCLCWVAAFSSSDRGLMGAGVPPRR